MKTILIILLIAITFIGAFFLGSYIQAESDNYFVKTCNIKYGINNWTMNEITNKSFLEGQIWECRLK